MLQGQSVLTFPDDYILLPGENIGEFNIKYTRSYMSFEKIAFQVNCTASQDQVKSQPCPVKVIIREDKVYIITIEEFRPVQYKSIQIIIKV